VQLIPMPAALLAFRLRSSLGCQKQVGIPDRGRSPEKIRKHPMNAKRITIAATLLASSVAVRAATVSVSFSAYDQAAQSTPYYSHFGVTSDVGVPGWYGAGDGVPEVVSIVNLMDSGWGFSATGTSSYHVMSKIETTPNSPRPIRTVGWHNYGFTFNTLTNSMNVMMDGNVIQSGTYSGSINWFMFAFNGHSQESVMDDFVVSYDGNVVYQQGFDTASLDPAWFVTRRDSGGYVTSGDTSNPHSGAGALALGSNVSGIAFDLRTVPEPGVAVLAVLGTCFGMVRRRRRVCVDQESLSPQQEQTYEHRRTN